MTILQNLINSVKGISIKWKMLAPFLFFAFTGTTVLTLISLRSQQNLILKEEASLMTEYHKDFQETVNHKAEQALAIASSIAENPEVGRLLSMGDRQSLIQLLNPVYERLENEVDVSQFHIYVAPANFFLTLHKFNQPDEDISNKKGISEVLSQGTNSSFIEKGKDYLCLMGMVPVYNKRKIVGAMGVGQSLDNAFIKRYSATNHINAALYDIKGPGDYRLIAFSGKKPAAQLEAVIPEKMYYDSSTILIHPVNFSDRSIVIGPLKDLSGKVAALIVFEVDRSEILDRLVDIRNLLAITGLAGIAISFILTYLMVSLLTKPLREIVKEAQDIAMGKRESRLESRPNDEIGSLANALNSMLEALKQRRLEIEEHARTLENRVKERMSEFLVSEEKYRTLVENAPLIVYRVRRDGTTEFINSKLTENTGYSVEEALNDKNFWSDKISGVDRKVYNTINKKCFIEGKPCRIESRVMAKDGRILTFITHAIPSKDADGRVNWIDGIMMDITELKKLQDSAIQTEGIRTIGEISARMAHELRNPLSAAGGFAYRLKESLKEDPANRKMAEIIFEEIAKLENFVKILLSSIEPFELSFSEVDINSLLLSWIEELDPFARERNISLIKDFEIDMPKIQADHDRLNQAIGNILKHAVISTPDGEMVFIYTSWAKDNILITLTHKVDKITANDMDKFFFPHMEQDMDKSLLDLPLSKIVIQRHGGKIDLIREKGDVLIMKIRFYLS
jgi:PAS domain S-box-containing protein